MADIPRMKQIDDPHQEGQKALLVKVFVVREADWNLFNVPPAVEQVREAEERRASGGDLEGTPLV